VKTFFSLGNNDIKYGILASSRNTHRDVLSELAAFGLRRMEMISLGLFVRLEAKPGKEKDVAAFLKQGLQMANQEKTTTLWFALRLGPSTFAIFDAFPDESGRQTHLNGPIAKALMANAPDLLAEPPSIEKTEILGAKLPQEVRSAA
jgi:quinol monooxygenase YgiN